MIPARGSRGQCGWLKDRWVVSWQIVSTRLFQLFADAAPNRSRCAIEVMMKTSNSDIAVLERAVDGA